MGRRLSVDLQLLLSKLRDDVWGQLAPTTLTLYAKWGGYNVNPVRFYRRRDPAPGLGIKLAPTAE